MGASSGASLQEEESVHEAAIRELREETGVEEVYLEQLYTFGDPKRDPRGRVVTVAYYALVPQTQVLEAGTDAADAAWVPVTELPPLAFDHRKIVEYAHVRIRNKLDYTNVGFELLPEKFTLTELQSVATRSDSWRAARQAEFPPQDHPERHREADQRMAADGPQAGPALSLQPVE